MGAAIKVVAPVSDFSGVVAGVVFKDGVGSTDSPTALNYFHRHGYGVDGSEPVRPDEPEAEPEAEPETEGGQPDEGDTTEGDTTEGDEPEAEPETPAPAKRTPRAKK